MIDRTKASFRAGRHSLTVWQQAREAVWPIVVFYLSLTWGILSFTAAITVGGDLRSLSDYTMFAVIVGLGYAGGAIGQLMAFAGLRTWILLAFGVVCWVLGAIAAAYLTALGDAGAIIAMTLFLLPITTTAGAWSLETHRVLFSTWSPLLYTIAGVIAWSEFQGHDAQWFAGNKWAIWDGVSLAMLGGQVGLILLMLVAREGHRLALWRRGPHAPLVPSLTESGAARPRVTVVGLVLLGALAVVLTLFTAVVSPYLWRSAPEDGREPCVDCVAEEETEAQPPPDMSGWAELIEKVVQAAQQAAGTVCTLLTLLLLALIGVLVAWRPLRRLALLRHLRDPIWPVLPTTRIEHGWRLVEIALGDLGVHPQPGEDAAGLARRARPVLERLSPVEVHGLEDAAVIADRVRFGLGVGPEDVATMTRFARWATDTVWERMDDRQQMSAMYRAL